MPTAAGRAIGLGLWVWMALVPGATSAAEVSRLPSAPVSTQPLGTSTTAPSAGGQGAVPHSTTTSVVVSMNVVSAVSMTVSTVAVAAAAGCEGGSDVAALRPMADNRGSIDFGSAVSTLTAKSVSNGCAFRVEGSTPGLHVVAALKATLQVSGHPGASVAMVRGETARGWKEAGIPLDNLKYVGGNNGTVDWRRSAAGQAVPAAGNAAAVLGSGLRSGDSVEHQLAVFLPDDAQIVGTHSASVLYTATGI